MGARDVESWSDWSEVGDALRATLAAEPDLVGQEARVYAAFLSLPPTWRAAVWLHEVEGAAPAAIARRLGTTPSVARGAVRSARAALKRHVAAQHETDGRAECRALASTYRFTPPAYLSRKDSAVLREHARHCDGCLPLVRDIFILDHGLRHRLAGLIPAEARAAGPVRGRHRGGRHAAPKSFAAGPVLTPTRGRSLVGGLSLAAAAVSVSVLLRPLDSPGSGPSEGVTADDLPDLTRPVAIAAAGYDPATRPAVAGRTSAEGRADRSPISARATDQSSRSSSNGPADQEVPVEPSAQAPTETSPPPASSGPGSPAEPPPSGDGSPPPDSGPPPSDTDPPPSDPPPSDPPPSDPPPSDPPPSSDLPSVEAEVGDDGATVTVDPGPVPVEPVEVGAELPG